MISTNFVSNHSPKTVFNPRLLQRLHEVARLSAALKPPQVPTPPFPTLIGPVRPIDRLRPRPASALATGGADASSSTAQPAYRFSGTPPPASVHAVPQVTCWCGRPPTASSVPE